MVYNVVPELPTVLPLTPLTRTKSGTADLRYATDEGSSVSGTAEELPKGCYYARWTAPEPNPRYTHLGTMRIEKSSEGITASADFYSHLNYRTEFLPTPVTEYFPEPNPPSDIPVFSRDEYSFYLRVEYIDLEELEVSSRVLFNFERYMYDRTNHGWEYDDIYRAELGFDRDAPAEYPKGTIYLHGNIYNDRSQKWAGVLTLACISPHLRTATVEIDRYSLSESPLSNGFDVTWRSIFEQAEWDMKVNESDSNLPEPSGESWSMAELHAAMIEHRDSADLDKEWRYHLLCVRQLDFTSRGVMYDAYEFDTNSVPREGAAISSHWMIPNHPLWGTVAGDRFGSATGPYFRTAVHEIGHAMGLYHNTVDTGIMNATNAIAASRGTFPDNIQWSFNSQDMRRLKHWPDPWVRPGMIPFGRSYSSVPISPIDESRVAKMINLEVKPLLPAVPLGAPVRVRITLRNKSKKVVMAPGSLSFKYGNVDGFVGKACGAVNEFRSILSCTDTGELQPLDPGDEICNDLTLLRGLDGPLFDSPGLYKITVKVTWKESGAPICVRGIESVMIQPATTDRHATAALKTLSTPELLLTLAIGGDHLKEGLEALKVAMADETLAPHYAVIEAKRLARPFRYRCADPSAAIKVLKTGAVISSSEAKCLRSIMGGRAKHAKVNADDREVEKLMEWLQRV